ncbi:MAG: dodecin domain-containing protein [Acidobacteria bacterium]|nr:MAG: dodecin domain-containing protein [Acidobacteriota bacterium]
MSVAKVIEVAASSPKSFQDAIDSGVERAAKTVNNLQGGWIKEMKVDIENGKVTAYRVNMKLTFVLED